MFEYRYIKKIKIWIKNVLLKGKIGTIKRGESLCTYYILCRLVFGLLNISVKSIDYVHVIIHMSHIIMLYIYILYWLQYTKYITHDGCIYVTLYKCLMNNDF